MNPISAFFGAVLGLHHPVYHRHVRAPIVVIERRVPAEFKVGEPLAVGVTDQPESVPLPSGSNFEVRNIGDHPVHLVAAGRPMTVEGESEIFLRGRIEPITASTDPGQISILKVWELRARGN